MAFLDGSFLDTRLSSVCVCVCVYIYILEPRASLKKRVVRIRILLCARSVGMV